MSKTGGGRGSNQYGPHGTPVGAKHRAQQNNTPPLTPLSLGGNRAAHANEIGPHWGDLSSIDLSGIKPTTTQRAIWRLAHRKTNLVFNDARLEGGTFTEPQVKSLLNGDPIELTDEDTANQVFALSEATDEMVAAVQDGSFSLSANMSGALHATLARFEAIDAGLIRGQGAVRTEPEGLKVNVFGDTFYAIKETDGGQNLRSLFDEGVDRVSQIKHPVLRGAAWSAYATYHQFYFDGNKRTSRLMMNGELISNGFDAIVLPAARKREYETALRDLFLDSDANPLIGFLVSCYDDR